MKAGHSFTKDFQRPFDEIFMASIQETAKYICENTILQKEIFTSGLIDKAYTIDSLKEKIIYV